MASATSAIKSPAFGPTMPAPITRRVAGSNSNLVMPSLRPRLRERPLAAQGNVPFSYARPCVLASDSVSSRPRHFRIRVSNRRYHGRFECAFFAGGDFRRDLGLRESPCVRAWGCPTMSPMAKIWATLVRLLRVDRHVTPLVDLYTGRFGADIATVRRTTHCDQHPIKTLVGGSIRSFERHMQTVRLGLNTCDPWCLDKCSRIVWRSAAATVLQCHGRHRTSIRQATRPRSRVSRFRSTRSPIRDR